MYFDYKVEQRTTDIAASLLTQLVCQLDKLPTDLVSLYHDCSRNGTRPDQASLLRLLVSLSQSFCRTYGVFDALDEAKDWAQKPALAIFSYLEHSGFRLLISFRPHVNLLRSHLSSARILDIRADEADLKNYITTRLDEEGNKSKKLLERCLELCPGAKGM
jgi:hypothetical protein